MATATAIPTGTWQVDPIHSSIGFEVKHFGISTFRGRFTGYEGTIETSEDGLERVEGSIEVGSFDVEDETLSGHLASEDFFDIEHHPLAHFSSTSIERTGDDSYRLDGELTLRGVTRPVELDVKLEGVGVDPSGGERIAFSATGELNRGDYGISWNNNLENGAPMVGEKVRLVLAAEAALRKEEA